MDYKILLKTFAIAKKCNNSEYSFVVSSLTNQFVAHGVESLKFPEGVFEKFQADVTKLKDLLLLSRSASESVKLDAVGEELNRMLTILFGVIRLEMKSVIVSKAQAAMELNNVLKSYYGIRKSPRRQKLAQVESMLYDLAKEDLDAYVQTLGLADDVETITLKTAQYSVLLNTRAQIQIQKSLTKTWALREEMDELLDTMLTCIRYANLTNPSEELTSLILSVNKLFSDAETEYNQRMAQLGKKEESESTEEGGESDGEGHKPTGDEMPNEEQGAADAEQ